MCVEGVLPFKKFAKGVDEHFNFNGKDERLKYVYYTSLAPGARLGVRLCPIGLEF